MNLIIDKSNQKLKTGDIILTSKKHSPFLKAMRFFQKDFVLYSHTLIVKDEYFAYEAKGRIRITNIKEVLDNCDAYLIVRKKNFTKYKKELMIRLLKDLVGRPYSYKRLFLQVLDNVFHTNKFTRLLKSIDNQICSSLVAWVYYVLFEIKFNNKNWYSADPDDLHDELSINKNDWFIIDQDIKETN